MIVMKKLIERIRAVYFEHITMILHAIDIRAFEELLEG